LPEFRSKTLQYGNRDSPASCNNLIAYNPDKWEELADLIVDIHDMRLKTMDKGTPQLAENKLIWKVGCEYQILSWTSHGAQGYSDKAEAEKVARRANDYMAEQVKKNPKRFTYLRLGGC
jgi:predicted TIM-barrel fold metal-dependent hydrolase